MHMMSLLDSTARSVAAHASNLKQNLGSTFAMSKGQVAVIVGMAATTAGVILVMNRGCPEIATTIRQQVGARLSSKLVSVFCGDTMSDDRREFKNMPLLEMIEHTVPKNHSHPEAAILRCKANTFMSSFITSLGADDFSISVSKSEQDRGVAGVRDVYHAKDLQMKQQGGVISEFDSQRQVTRMTDVDYYVNMPTYLDGRRLIIYTFVPREAGGSTANGTFCFEDNEVVMKVNGGATYRHKLWDYDTDHLMVDHWWGSVLYLVEQLEVSPDRRLIYFNPVRKVYGPLGWLIPGDRLFRRNVSSNSCNFTKFQTTCNNVTETYHSYSLKSRTNSVTIRESAIVSSEIRLTKSKAPQISDVERLIRASYEADKIVDRNAANDAAILFRVFETNPQLLRGSIWVPTVTCGVVDTHSYQACGKLVTEDGKPSMRRVGNMFLDDAFAPVKSYNNDEACVKGRLEDPKNKTTKYPPFYYQCRDEFVRFLVPDSVAGTLCPIDDDAMASKFKRPTQKALLARAREWMFCDTKWTIASFQKAEPYGKVGNPRNIATLPMDQNFRYGAYCYALSDGVFKKQHWYAFGHHPRVIASMLVEKTKRANLAFPHDYTSLDGTMGQFQHDLKLAVLRRAFAPCYHKELLRCADKEIKANAITRHGVSYGAGLRTNSGSSSTTWCNSVSTALNSYIAHRYDHGPVAAWEALGMYGGDDGVNFDINPAVLKKVAVKMGMIIKLETVHPGSPVSFLGRVFVDPWTSIDCQADVHRQVRKLHLTATPPIVPDTTILRRKAIGMLVTDAETPFIGAWARKIMQLCPANSKMDERYALYLRHDQSYYSKFESPFQNCSDEELAYNIAAEPFGITGSELKDAELKVSAVTSLSEMNLLGELFQPKRSVELTAVVKGEILTGQMPRPVQQKLAVAKRTPMPAKTSAVKPPRERKAQQPCQFVVAGGKCPRQSCRFDHRDLKPVRVVRPVKDANPHK